MFYSKQWSSVETQGVELTHSSQKTNRNFKSTHKNEGINDKILVDCTKFLRNVVQCTDFGAKLLEYHQYNALYCHGVILHRHSLWHIQP